MRRPTPRCAGSAPSESHRRTASPLPGSCGSTTTIPTRRTSRRATWPSASRGRPTTARSRSWTASSAPAARARRAETRPARTLVLVTADHGESLGEHGEGTHGIFVYDATLRVPWVMAGPGIPAGRVSATVARSIDVLPTLADYRRASAAHRYRGALAAARGRRARDGRRAGLRRVALLRARARMGAAARLAGVGLQVHQGAAAGAVRPGEGRLGDDESRCGAAGARRGFGRQARSALRRPTPAAAAAPAVDPEAAERLRALGYASGGRAGTSRRCRPARSEGRRFGSCRGSIAGCPRRERSPSSPSAS